MLMARIATEPRGREVTRGEQPAQFQAILIFANQLARYAPVLAAKSAMQVESSFSLEEVKRSRVLPA